MHATPARLQRGLLRAWIPRGEQTDRGALFERVLAARGFEDAVASHAFMSPTLKDLHDPSTIPDLDRAAERLLEAIARNERIVIYGDYDVDGTTAAAILFHTLLAIAPSADVVTYIPHRVDEGYGVHADAVRTLANEGARVIVTVDCGITGHEAAVTCRDLGVDLLVTDHHTPPASVEDHPNAVAVVHPGRADSAYPFHGLCGAGVAYKLAWRLCTLAHGESRVSPELRALLLDLLGLTSLGTIADVVPLIDENRAITRHGLTTLRGSRIEGLRALIAACGLDSSRICEEDVGFKLAPRLNACGRLGHARETLELLTTATGARAEELASSLSKLNDKRRSMERAIFEQASEQAIEAGMDAPGVRAIVLAQDDWHPGVVGIVCSRMVERFSRPTILLTRDGGALKGSGRSIDGFNLHDALSSCADLLIGFGGHDHAAGMKLDASNLDAFRERFSEIARDELTDEDLVLPLAYDASCTIGELSIGFMDQVTQLAPFGRGNPSIRVRLEGLKLTCEATPFGARGDHLGLVVTDGTRQMRLVGWNWAERADAFQRGVPFDAIVTPKVSSWNGTRRVEPVLEDALIS